MAVGLTPERSGSVLGSAAGFIMLYTFQHERIIDGLGRTISQLIT